MNKIDGKFSTANIYASIIDDTTIKQVEELTNHIISKESHIAIMPDCHAGKGCVIGTTMTINDKIIPNLVGVDIGCGMLTVKLNNVDINLKELDNFIHSSIPCGLNVYDDIVDSNVDITKLRCYNFLDNKKRLHSSIGTLGGGNHFIEIDVDSLNNKYLVIHSGSRNLGLQVCEHYQDIAIKEAIEEFYNNIRKEIELLRNDGRKQEIEKYVTSKRKEFDSSFNKALAYLKGKSFDDYMHDMDICQKFASENRFTIATKILNFLGLNIKDYEQFETIHNYINMNDMILRKGAISAYQDEIVLIPINMKDGSIIGKGKSNKDYNYSAPHGAGRVLSRKKAFETISLSDYIQVMEGIYSTTVSKDTLDEAPFAYKNINDILNNIVDTVEVIEIIKPIYNFKATE